MSTIKCFGRSTSTYFVAQLCIRFWPFVFMYSSYCSRVIYYSFSGVLDFKWNLHEFFFTSLGKSLWDYLISLNTSSWLSWRCSFLQLFVVSCSIVNSLKQIIWFYFLFQMISLKLLFVSFINIIRVSRITVWKPRALKWSKTSNTLRSFVHGHYEFYFNN